MYLYKENTYIVLKGSVQPDALMSPTFVLITALQGYLVQFTTQRHEQLCWADVESKKSHWFWLK